MIDNITALESYKISIALEDFVQKLSFLDVLKSNAGEESNEQASEEITKAMDEQRSLETQYGNLVIKRSTLKGLRHKQELSDTLVQIQVVSKELKKSTVKLCRQLQESQDDQGNQRMVKTYKNEVVVWMEELMVEMQENQSLNTFKAKITKSLDQQEEFDKLKEMEQQLNLDITSINEQLKKQQDDYAKEAQESADDMTIFKQRVNETQTESELNIQYQKRWIEGQLQRKRRLHQREQTELENKIKDLTEQRDVEKVVSGKITDYIKRRRVQIEGRAEDRDRLKESKIKELGNDKEKIQANKEEADKKIQEMQALCEEQEEFRRAQTLKDEDNAKAEEAKIYEKIAMEQAAKYVQDKWNWYQTEGKFLAKKRKGKKGGKKKKKK